MNPMKRQADLRKKLFFLTLFCLLLLIRLQAQETEVVCDPSKSPLTELKFWKMQDGDKPGWSAVDFDDSGWETVDRDLIEGRGEDSSQRVASEKPARYSEQGGVNPSRSWPVITVSEKVCAYRLKEWLSLIMKTLVP